MENLSAQDLEEMRLKQQILIQNNTFKTAFTATLGFYAGQFVATILGVGVVSGAIFVVYELLK